MAIDRRDHAGPGVGTYTHAGGKKLGGFANCIRHKFTDKRNDSFRSLLLAKAV